MKLKELGKVLYSNTGNIQMAVLWDSKECNDIVDGCSIDYIIKNYGDRECKHIEAYGGKLVITV